MRQYSEESGIKVLDRSVAIVRSVASGNKTLAALSDDTALPRATTHRIACALEVHHILSRTASGEWTIGPALESFSSHASPRLLSAAAPLMRTLVATTGESVQLYELTGNTRTCIAAEEPASGLTYSVPVGSQLTLTAGSAARVFAAFSLVDAAFPASELELIRREGIAESVSEREVGLASVSAPIFNSDKTIAAVLSISGPVERLGPHPSKVWGNELKTASSQLSSALER